MRLIACVLAILAAVAVSQQAGPPQNILVFGDSMSDNGNNPFYFQESDKWWDYFYQPRFGGSYTNGMTWNEYLQRSLSDKYKTRVGLLNYAIAGATTDNANVQGRDGYQRVVNLPAVTDQVNDFIRSIPPPSAGDGAPVPRANSRDLYFLWAGNNDALIILQTYGPDLNRIVVAAEGAVRSLGNSVKRLYAAGARRFGLMNNFHPAAIPDQRKQGPDAVAMTGAMSIGFDNSLRQQITQLRAALPDADIRLVDMMGFSLDLAANFQTKYGFKFLDSCVSSNGRGFANISFTVCGKQEEFAYWDDFHPSTRTHKFMSDSILNGLPIYAPASDCSLPVPMTGVAPGTITINFGKLSSRA